MIEGIEIFEKKIIRDHRGSVMHMLRNDDPHFNEFGEIYFSTVLPGKVKGWHLHKKMTLNYVVPVGQIKFALFDEREDSPTKGNFMDMILDEDHYKLVRVPPGVWNGFIGLGDTRALVANCASIPHDPEEIVRIDPVENHIGYNWEAPPR